MAEQVRAQKEKQAGKVAEVAETEAVDLVDDQLTEDVDDMLAEIDDVLEENAEEFVKGYRQKGGQ